MLKTVYLQLKLLFMKDWLVPFITIPSKGAAGI